MKPIDITWVCIGGGIGSLLRWQIGQFIDARTQSSFKYGTLFITITGALIATSFCGGMSTFAAGIGVRLSTRPHAA
jgi:fluoride ion exporter CrcB/FEX